MIKSRTVFSRSSGLPKCQMSDRVKRRVVRANGLNEGCTALPSTLYTSRRPLKDHFKHLLEQATIDPCQNHT